MALLNPTHMKRRVEIARLLWKYYRRDIIQVFDLEESALREGEATLEEGEDPADLARDLEAMGPAFVKAGQLLSTRPDLLAPPYLEALARLQDNVGPFDSAAAAAIFEEEIGVAPATAFEQFETEPIAAASLAQVHRARTREGQEVVVKIQRPGIREDVLADLEVMEGMIALVSDHSEFGAQYPLDEMFREFRRTLLRELDFRQEARSLERIGANLAEYQELLVPQPVSGFCGSRVLTMDYIHGTNVGELAPLQRLGIPGEELAEALVKGYLDSILIHGVFNADPHPGNLLVTAEGELGLIDMGMVAYLGSRTQEQMMKLLLAISEGDPASVSDITVEMGERLSGYDRAGLERDIGQLLLPHREGSISELNLGRIVMEMALIASRHGLRPSSDITMLGKTLLNLDEAVRVLAPDLRPAEIIERHASDLMRRHMLTSLSLGNLFTSMLEANEFITKLPGRLNTLMEQFVEREFRVSVDVIDEQLFIENLQKIANRITVGLVIAALIVGAALLARVPTEFQLLGYPGLAIILFLVAAAIGLFLVAEILFHDRRRPR